MASEHQREAARDIPVNRSDLSMVASTSHGHPKRTHPHSSDSEQGSSDSGTSGSFIFNARKASPAPEESARSSHSTCQPNELDSGLAANMAMFVSLEPPKAIHTPWPNHSADELNQVNSKSLRRMQFLSGITSNDAADSQPLQSSNSLSKPDIFDELQSRKTASLNDVGSSLRQPKWPGNLASPVSPAVPMYPPPERPPTPPGLPSFGTQKAMEYSDEFVGRSRANARNGEHSRGRAVARDSDSNRTGSYGEALRRLFGLSPSPSRQTTPSSGNRIGRAPDGTAVQGRFPYRQSGHGSNVARRLEDHPFHRVTLPDIQSESENGRGSQLGLPTYPKDDPPAVLNPTPSYQDHRTDRSRCPYPLPPPSALPSIPSQAVTARPRLTSATALFSLPRTFSHSNRSPHPHSRLGDGPSQRADATDGPSDRCFTQEQPPLAETMQARSVVAAEPSDQEPGGFWDMTRSCFCRPVWDRNIRFSPWGSERTSVTQDDDNDSQTNSGSGVDWRDSSCGRDTPRRPRRRVFGVPLQSRPVVDPMFC